MNRSRAIFLVFAFLVTSPSVGQERQRNQGCKTPLSSPNEIGPFVVSWGMDPAEREKIMTRVRSFFWEHLQNHTPGQIRITFGNLEGGPTEHTLCIQASKKGDMVVLDHIATTQSIPLPSSERPKHKAYVQKLCTFDRMDNNSQKVIPDNEKRAPESFELRLKDCKTESGLIL